MLQNKNNFRKAVLADLDMIKTIADAHKHELGFILRPALADSIEKREIIVATNDTNLTGFIDYHHRKDEQTTLYSIAVLPEYRQQGIGRELIQSLVREAKTFSKMRILLKCPEDLPANKFYKALDFQLQEVVSGKRRKLRIWSREL